jgi:hypothetical protein
MSQSQQAVNPVEIESVGEIVQRDVCDSCSCTHRHHYLDQEVHDDHDDAHDVDVDDDDDHDLYRQHVHGHNDNATNRSIRAKRATEAAKHDATSIRRRQVTNMSDTRGE